MQHHFWKFYDNTHSQYDPHIAAKYSSVIPDFYEKIDSATGDILHRINEDTTVLVVSDHGAGPEEGMLTYSGTWNDYTNPNFTNGVVKYSNQKNATASISFFGSGVMWIASRDNRLGKADVYIDGNYEKTVDLYSPTIIHQEVVYSNLALSSGNHSMSIVVKGAKNPSATNTFVDIDAIDVVD